MLIHPMELVMRLRMSIPMIGSLVLLLLLTTTAFANETPPVCDDDTKYYCSKVWFAYRGTNQVDIYDRYYKGGIDGNPAGSTWWLFYAKDWTWNGSQWVFVESWGPSASFSNSALSAWKATGGARTRPKQSAVTIRTRYYDGANGNQWCSLIMQHNLEGGNSFKYGTGVCNPA
jgi:hypothetical protein